MKEEFDKIIARKLSFKNRIAKYKRMCFLISINPKKYRMKWLNNFRYIVEERVKKYKYDSQGGYTIYVWEELPWNS